MQVMFADSLLRRLGSASRKCQLMLLMLAGDLCRERVLVASCQLMLMMLVAGRCSG